MCGLCSSAPTQRAQATSALVKRQRWPQTAPPGSADEQGAEVRTAAAVGAAAADRTPPALPKPATAAAAPAESIAAAAPQLAAAAFQEQAEGAAAAPRTPARSQDAPAGEGAHAHGEAGEQQRLAALRALDLTGVQFGSVCR